VIGIVYTVVLVIAFFAGWCTGHADGYGEAWNEYMNGDDE
jgi:hypothetical protein